MLTDELVANVDAAHGHTWDIWRAQLGHWCVKITSKQVARVTVLSDASLHRVLQNAAEYRFLPEYPRCPRRISRDLFRIAKDGNRWVVNYDGNFMWTDKTKSSAEASCDLQCERNRIAIEDWEKTVLPKIQGKTEGVDFRYLS